MAEHRGLVLEYMEMGSLYDGKLLSLFRILIFLAIYSEGKFANKPLTYGLDRALSFMHNAACGIQRLHELKILHRDIKPAKYGFPSTVFYYNIFSILLGKSLDDVKIGDFSTAICLSTIT